MQREFKFRAWDKQSKRMVLNLYPKDFYKRVPSNIDDIWILMQYIGQKDEYGNKVYEGDIIEIYWPDGAVTRETISFSEKYGYFMYGNNPICELQDPIVSYKVVGNIYEQ